MAASRHIRAGFGRNLGAVAGAILAVGVLAAPAAADTSPPTADIGVVSIHANRATAARGSVVVFTEVIKNYGPEAVELDTGPQRVKTVKRDHPKIGRNDPCWCGSGKKFKHCHGKS